MLDTEASLRFKTFTVPITPGTGCATPVDDLKTLCITPFNTDGPTLRNQLRDQQARRQRVNPCP